jgi:hypothetical protein
VEGQAEGNGGGIRMDAGKQLLPLLFCIFHAAPAYNHCSSMLPLLVVHPLLRSCFVHLKSRYATRKIRLLP